jgi:hypothetical protein
VTIDLDMSPDGMDAEARAVAAPLDPWLQRRLHGFGASEIGTLAIALGHATDDAPKYMLANARTLFRQKAGLARARKAGRAADAGQRAERDVLRAWWESPAHLWPRAMLDTYAHADAAPRSWWPLVDRHCPRLTCTPDGWARSVLGEDVLLEVKTTASACDAVRWYWRLQVQAQLAVTACDFAVLVLGEFWAAEWRDPGPVRAWVIERDEDDIARVRAWVEEGWQRVEALRKESE